MTDHRNPNRNRWPYSPVYLILVVLYGVCAILVGNGIITHSGLMDISTKYGEVAERLYSLPLSHGLLLYGVVMPILEELLFRFVVAGFFWRITGKIAPAIVLSAILFGVYHGNVVQGVHGFCIGLLLAATFVSFEGILACILIHGCGNIVIYLSTMKSDIGGIFFGPVQFAIYSVITIIGTWYMIRFLYRGKENNA